MKTLYEKLSNEGKKALEDNRELYPNSTKSVENILKGSNYTLDISIGDALSIFSLLTTKPFDIHEFCKLFND